MRTPKIEHEWQVTQDHVIRSILSAMGWQRMETTEFCKRAGINKQSWSRIKNLKHPMQITTMVKLGLAVGLRWDLQLVPQAYRQTKSKAFTVWTES